MRFISSKYSVIGLVAGFSVFFAISASASMAETNTEANSPVAASKAAEKKDPAPEDTGGYEMKGGLEVKMLLQSSKSWNGAPIIYPNGQPEMTAEFITIAPETKLPWHVHPVPAISYILQGTLEVKDEKGASKIFHAGDTFAELIDTKHYGVNIGKLPVKLIMVFAGSKGVPNVILTNNK